MKALQTATAKMEELTMSEMKSVNGGQWVAVIFEGKKKYIWIEE